MIRYIEEHQVFILETKSTQYAMCVRPDGHLEHLCYGGRSLDCGEQNTVGLWDVAHDRSLFETGNAIALDGGLTLESLLQELSSTGKGDVSEPFVCMTHANGSKTCDFVYESYEIKNGRDELEGLPCAVEYHRGTDGRFNTVNEQQGTEVGSGVAGGLQSIQAYERQNTAGEVTQLTITLRDKFYRQKLELIYVTWDECDVITRSACLTNESDDVERVDRLMSMQLDMRMYQEYDMIHFGGAWAREMHRSVHPVRQGRVSVSSSTGTSGSRANPFFMVAEHGSSEEYGECYGFNLIYSGDHMESCEQNSYGRMRILSGINPEGFSFALEPGQSFQSPEAVMTYSDSGFGGVSSHMHAFVRRHIVRDHWADRERPVLLNSWEAAYFDINEKKLLKLAKEAKKCGIELFVMDDGWFGHRDNDTSSLGDWQENRSKLPGGVKQLADKINALGLDFGIWVEPEMVNEDSDLYRAHPEWAVRVPGQSHAEGRHQMLLDLTNKDVRDHIVEAMTNVFSSANISYVKWDMNRIMSDRYSQTLPPDRQSEFGHRYVLGLYDIMGRLTERFPEILFEGCAAGGNRFDLGILCYMPQIWASDDTDARERIEIQTGYSYGYPMSVVSSHVSGCPNHQTLRGTPFETRFGVAAFGVLGYECNLCDMKKKDLEAIKEQVEFYKRHRRTLQFGGYHRIENGTVSDLKRNVYQFMTVAQDGSEAVSCYYEGQVIPNYTYKHMRTKGLGETSVYVMEGRNLQYSVKLMGDLINTVTPVHVKPDSLAQSAIDKVVRLQGEKEYVQAAGAVFNRMGVNLAPNFAGTGYNDQTALWTEHGLRLYTFTRQ